MERQRAYKQLTLLEAWRSLPHGAQAHTHTAPAIDSRKVREWPRGITRINEIENPNKIVFESLEPDTECACEEDCRFRLCTNSQQGFFCTPETCAKRGMCGNSVPQTSPVYLVYNEPPLGYGLRVSKRIEPGVIVGTYAGVLKMRRSRQEMIRSHYIVKLKATPSGYATATAFIDASQRGSIMRFANHSCRAASRFEELSHGDKLIVAVVTTRVVEENEPLTVDYGGRLWFVCHCGESNCRRPR